jgi:GNAT superfamily N-acetyltransferase
MLRIRPATVNDAPLLVTMIRELADFEREPDSVTITDQDLVRDGFGGRGMFLEDLFVREAFRGRGIGTSLMAAVARITVEEQRYGIHWEVLDWNENAIEVYKALGAEFRDQWRPVLLMGEALLRLAEKAS